MSQTAGNIQNRTNPIATYRPNEGSHPSKTLGVALDNTKNLGGALGGSDTSNTSSQWIEENRYIYDAIMNGTSDLAQADQALFMEWWNWASEDAFGSSFESNWDPNSVTGGEAAPSESVQPAPEGAILGPDGNVVWDQQNVELTHTDDNRPQDVFAETLSLDVTSYSALVTAERTSDTRHSPPEEVTKITVQNKATGAETVYFLHGDAKAVIRTSKETQLIDNTDAIDPDLVTWEQYQEPSAEGADAEATTKPSYSGGEVEIDETGLNFSHTALAGETIQFTPQPNAAGVEIHEVYGDSNITLRSDYKADLSYDSETKTHIITVSDSEGNAIAKYRIHENCKVQVNMNEAFLTVTNGKGKDRKTVAVDEYDAPNNDFWKEDFSLNGELAKEFTKPEETKSEEKTEDKKEPKVDESYYNNFQDFLDTLNVSEGTAWAAISELYPELGAYDKNSDGKLSAAEMEKAAKAKDGIQIPPERPNTRFLQLLGKLDSNLKNMINSFVVIEEFPGNEEEYLSLIRDRVVNLLSDIYPKLGQVRTDESDDDAAFDNVIFNGKKYDVINQQNYDPENPESLLWFVS